MDSVEIEQELAQQRRLNDIRAKAIDELREQIAEKDRLMLAVTYNVNIKHRGVYLIDGEYIDAMSAHLEANK